MASIPIRPIAAVLLVLNGGCTGGSTAVVASNADAPYPGSRGRLLVAGRIGAGTPRAQAFPGHLATGLRACGVEPDMAMRWVSPALALKDDATSRSVAERHAARPDALLELDQIDTEDTPGSLCWTYAPRLRTADGATIWRARFDFRPHSGWGYNDPSADLARMVVERMAADGVLRSCPASRT